MNKTEPRPLTVEFYGLPRARAGRKDLAVKAGTAGEALEAAKKQGLLTIAFSGRGGGRLVDVAESCFTVPSYSTHRIQESHVALLHILWDLTHVALGEEDII